MTIIKDKTQSWHEPRHYRSEIKKEGLTSFNVIVKETDLFILADDDLSLTALTSIHKYRNIIEEYISLRPEFQFSLRPISEDHIAPSMIREMIAATSLVGVGPMACVAGAIAQSVSHDILQFSRQVIVENGGDNYLKCDDDIRVGLYSGRSILNGKLTLKIKAKDMPLGICTSSGTIGHSLSMGKADAVSVISKSAFLADAAATAIGNRVKSERDIRSAAEYGINLEGVLGVLIVMGKKIGAAGAIELC